MQALQKLYTGFGKTKAALVAVVLLCYMCLVAYGGASPLGAVRLWGVMGVYILLPGYFWARVLRVRRFAQGFVMPAAILLGTGFFAVWVCVCMRFGLVWLLRAAPLCLGVAEAVLWLAGGGPAGLKGRRGRPAPHLWLLVLLGAFLVFLYTFRSVAHNAHPLAVGNVLLDQDLLWNAGNAASFQLGFPPQDIRFVGVRLHYHYLTELLAGGLAAVSGLPAYDVVAFYMQPVMLCAMVACLYRFARVVWPGQVAKPVLYVYSLFLFSCASLWKILPNGLSSFWNAHITHLVTNINSVTTSVVFLSIFMGLLWPAAQKRWRMGPAELLLLVGGFVLLAFAKGPLAALVLIALVLALLVGLPLGRTGWRGIVLGAVLAAVFALVYSVMFASGANDSTSFSLYGTLELGYFGNLAKRLAAEAGGRGRLLAGYGVLYLVQSFLMAPAQTPLYLAGLWRDVRGFRRLTVPRLMANAMVVGGFAAFFLFYHPALSQMYFLFGGLFFLNLLAVDRAELLARPARGLARKGFKAVAAVCAAVGLVTTAFLYTNMVGSGARQVLRNMGVLEKYPYTSVMNADDEAAALWLAENTGGDALFATNRIHTGQRREGVSNLYSALSGRQAFMEGFQYAKTNMGVSAEEIGRRLDINTALFDAATPPEQVAALMRENGINYLVYTAQTHVTQTVAEEDAVIYLPPGGQFDALEEVFASDSVWIYRLGE